MMNKEKEFEINGVITTPDGVSEEQFTNAILEFFEAKGWSFGGGINELKDEI